MAVFTGCPAKFGNNNVIGIVEPLYSLGVDHLSTIPIPQIEIDKAFKTLFNGVISQTQNVNALVCDIFS